MKIGDLNVGDLLRFDNGRNARPGDLGIVTATNTAEYTDDEEIAVHWFNEGENPCYHDNHEMNDWLTRGLVEVV